MRGRSGDNVIMGGLGDLEDLSADFAEWGG